MRLDRRKFVAGLSAFGMGIASLPSAASARSSTFGFQNVIDIARKSAGKPYVPPTSELPSELTNLGYDAYRGIRFLPDKGTWKHDNLGFHLEFFHRGGLNLPRVDIFEIRNGKARPLQYDAGQFSFDPRSATAPTTDIGYAGFRIHAHNVAGLDEMAVFLGASYFRSLAANQNYGLSGRGLALATASARGEEFPLFRSFWIERPKAGDGFVNVYGLLDSPSVTGAYRFKITSGTATVFDVECTLFPRVMLDLVGIAPLTSMYLYGPADKGGFDDFRDAVHDCDGLELLTGKGEPIWRAVSNPPQIEESAFQDVNPRGFGLMQRERSQAVFQDFEARYDRRPSAWVKPAGDWGAGAVHLFELPSDSEGIDNIVAMWRPAAPLQPHQGHSYRYTVTWGTPEISPASSGRVLQTRTGKDINGYGRVFIVDFTVSDTDPSQLTAQAQASAGTLSPVRLQSLDAPNLVGSSIVRASFHLDPGTAKSADLRLSLLNNAAPSSEIWMFRWTS